MTRRIIIYTRYSSELQSSKSCEDQERQIREGLDKMGIDHRNAVVIKDEAESGTKSSRPGFQQVDALMKSGQISILVVDDQSRLTRGANALSFIEDLRFNGARFLSLGDNIDTDQENWRVMVQVMGIHNSTTIQELGRRVKRGQVGRLLRGLTTGDYPLGYESYFVNPEEILQTRRGPKPEKNIRVLEPIVKCIRQVFEWFHEGRSINEIARRLTKQKVPRGPRAKHGLWDRHQVRRMLGNEKYIGIWIWGKTKTSRSSAGKVKQVAMPEKEWIHMEHPDLRIIDQVVWGKTQTRLSEIRDITGFKPGQKKRGAKIHHSSVYPTGLLNGLLFCECGARMWHHDRQDMQYFTCPCSRKNPEACKMTSHVPTPKAREAIVGAVVAMLKSQPDWRDAILSSIQDHVEKLSMIIPVELDQLRKRERELSSRIDNLISFIANGTVQSDSIASRLDEFESERREVRAKLKYQESLSKGQITAPTKSFIDEQLTNMASFFSDDSLQAAMLLRKLVSKVTATHGIPIGKKRGFTQIRFRIDGWGAKRVAAESDPQLMNLIDSLATACGVELTHPDEIVVDLGKPTLANLHSPTIYEMRNNGATLKEIEAVTGIGNGNACTYYKRYAKGLKAQSSLNDDQSDDLIDTELPVPAIVKPETSNQTAA